VAQPGNSGKTADQRLVSKSKSTNKRTFITKFTRPLTRRQVQRTNLDAAIVEKAPDL
jgi:hypothetical protein